MINHPERKAEPVPAGNRPLKMKLAAGKYFWCSCGRSTNAPWCNGLHKNTGIRPFRFVIEQECEVFICQCKKTSNPPFCDESHLK
ncbi:MAG: cytochrome C551 [Bacteroidetes bacterium HGW-Bacteroidetes-6]|jgi:CDGSH-type Zn-finger protein|nr:MAG: cytochrome C551 [Bacteroidetes bacterium HGW-Bacteroidetes-6]